MTILELVPPLHAKNALMIQTAQFLRIHVTEVIDANVMQVDLVDMQNHFVLLAAVNFA